MGWWSTATTTHSPLAQLQADAQLPPLLQYALDDPWVWTAPALYLTPIQAPALSPAPALNTPGGAAALTRGAQLSRLQLLIPAKAATTASTAREMAGTRSTGVALAAVMANRSKKLLPR